METETIKQEVRIFAETKPYSYLIETLKALATEIKNISESKLANEKEILQIDKKVRYFENELSQASLNHEIRVFNDPELKNAFTRDCALRKALLDDSIYKNLSESIELLKDQENDLRIKNKFQSISIDYHKRMYDIAKLNLENLSFT